MSTGNLFIVAAPSGAGKTTLVRLLLARDPDMRLSISYTTRPPREGEDNGREYRFVSAAEFLAMSQRSEFAESAEVHKNFYGTSKAWLAEQMAAGHDILLEIDWQGAQQVKKQFPQAIGIFILPPSMTELERRLRDRGTDSNEVIARRLTGALGEMRHVDEFDFAIINNDLDEALEDLLAVVRATRLRVARQRTRNPAVFKGIS